MVWWFFTILKNTIISFNGFGFHWKNYMNPPYLLKKPWFPVKSSREKNALSDLPGSQSGGLLGATVP